MIRTMASQGHCVYYLIHGSEVVRVGYSANVTGRIGSHQVDKVFDSYVCVRFPAKLQALEFEDDEMFRLRPKYNLRELAQKQKPAMERRCDMRKRQEVAEEKAMERRRAALQKRKRDERRVQYPFLARRYREAARQGWTGHVYRYRRAIAIVLGNKHKLPPCNETLAMAGLL